MRIASSSDQRRPIRNMSTRRRRHLGEGNISTFQERLVREERKFCPSHGYKSEEVSTTRRRSSFVSRTPRVTGARQFPTTCPGDCWKRQSYRAASRSFGVVFSARAYTANTTAADSVAVCKHYRQTDNARPLLATTFASARIFSEKSANAKYTHAARNDGFRAAPPP